MVQVHVAQPVQSVWGMMSGCQRDVGLEAGSFFSDGTIILEFSAASVRKTEKMLLLQQTSEPEEHIMCCWYFKFIVVWTVIVFRIYLWVRVVQKIRQDRKYLNEQITEHIANP